MFNKYNTIASRVKSVLKTDIEAKGKAWLAGLGYAESNDYAQSVVFRVSVINGGVEHIRFETVARYIRDEKASIRKELKAQVDTTVVAQ